MSEKSKLSPNLNGALSQISLNKKLKGPSPFTILYFGEKESKTWQKAAKPYLLHWQIKEIEKNPTTEIHNFSGTNGYVSIVLPQYKNHSSHNGALERSLFSIGRDLVGSLAPKMKMGVEVVFKGAHQEEFYGALVGIEIGLYKFKSVNEKPPKISIQVDDVNLNRLVNRGHRLGAAVNVARHLINLPPNELHPESYAAAVVDLFKAKKNVKTEVWNSSRLKSEGMGLHLAVGSGGVTPPCMVRIKYRHPKVKTPPIAIVGKGVTFDSGGLDIKPSAAMRLMKKDMGGSAACVGFAHWAVASEIQQNFDVYLALAENSIDSKSFRPSDVVTARNGMKIEIDNTDAEGRLVMADVIDVAVTQKGADEPRLIIDVSTLTGAIKASLGTGMSGLFSNDDELADQLGKAGVRAGDRSWRMPLIPEYLLQLQSTVADMVNSANGFGGAVTAALFLERFVRGKKWAHFDMYAWKDRPEGAWTEPGGSGQTVMQLCRWIENLD